MPYKFLEHTADVKIEVTEKTLEKAFISSALALKEVMSDNASIKPKIKKEIKIKSENNESLLYDFLEQFLYLFDAKDFIINDIAKIKITKSKGKLALIAKVIGDRASSYEFTNDVKAITYNEMKIERKKGRFIIQFVLDV
jgi:SHS2 domain-containing protein